MQIKLFISVVFMVIAMAFIGLTSMTLITYSHHATTQNRLLNYKDSGIVLTDRNNEPFYFFNEARIDRFTKLDEISDDLESAVIAAEDSSFYDHSGISITGILRSVVLNLKTQSLSYGGSTITQQLVKNTLLTSEKSLLRKYQEGVLSFYIEQRFSKDEILEMYLNTVYYGEGAIGINDASKIYFNKTANELSLGESAFLAGLLQSPSLLSPYSGAKGKAEGTKKAVLIKMLVDKEISEDEYKKSIAQELKFVQRSQNLSTNSAPHYALLVEDELRKMYGNDVIYEGLSVKTSIDLGWQSTAEDELKAFLDSQPEQRKISNGAVVVMHPQTGEILVLVGSKSWYNDEYGKVNMATVPRQPGSSFKPLVYAAALDEGAITPATILTDKKREFAKNYTPENYDKRYRGEVTVRRALSNSLNVPSVEIMQMVGVQDVLDKSKDFGITSLKDASNYGPALVLGSGEVSLVEMVNAYSALANEGMRPNPVVILEVKNKYGEVIYENTPEHKRVISKETAFLITSILSDESSRREVFGNILSIPITAAVKTGTTENFRDGWTIGYTPEVVVGVWTGNSDNTPMGNIPGSQASAPVWKTLIQNFTAKSKDFVVPKNMVQASFCIPNSSGSAQLEYFVKGTAPKTSCGRPSSENIAVNNIEVESPPEVTPSPQLNIGGPGEMLPVLVFEAQAEE